MNYKEKNLPIHGGDIYTAAKTLGLHPEDICDFSTNSNDFAQDLTENLVNETPYPFKHYPDNQCAELCKSIAAHENVTPDKILAGNGSSELIFLAMQTLAPSSVIMIGPIFAEYARACESLKIPYHILSLPKDSGFAFGRNEMNALWKIKADLAVLCTPNNPTGVTYENIATVLEIISCPRILIDNTYREFLWDEEFYEENSWLNYQQHLKPGAAVLSLNSFTKFFNCTGIRLGYMVADRTLINTLNNRRAPWTVSGFAQNMGIKLLSHLHEYRELLPKIRWNRNCMARELTETGLFNANQILQGPSFLTLEVKPPLTAAELKNRLLKWHILIRVCDNIPGMPPNYVRIQVKSDTQCERLYTALRNLH